jgi:hypothetical protein
VNSVLEAVFLLLNVAVITGFLVFVSYSKHLHIFLAPINVGTSRRPRALGGLDKTPDMDMENVSEDTVFGAGKMEDFTWKQMLDFATCTECGRCQSVCPAWTPASRSAPSCSSWVCATTCSPRPIDCCRVRPVATWRRWCRRRSTPTCCGPARRVAACVEQCPVDIEHVDAIIDMRRYEVLMESRFPSEAGLLLRNMENQGDPWGLGSRASAPSGWRALDFEVPIIDGRSPTTSSTSTGWAAPARSTSAVASRSSRRRACCTAPA